MRSAGHRTKRAGKSDARWTVTTATGITFICRVETIGAFHEVRLTTEPNELVCARVVPSAGAADAIVGRWLRAVVSSNSASEPAATEPAMIVH